MTIYFGRILDISKISDLRMKNIASKKKQKKFVLVGLDNVGKTSIALSLERNMNLMSYCSLRPTQGRDIIIVEDQEFQYNIWDLGGQETFRKEYLGDPDEYFQEIDKILYVIDIQDTERYDLAIQYLKDIINIIKDYQVDSEFNIFLHKYDPNYEEIPNFPNKDAYQALVKRIKEIIPPRFNCKIYKTTIFTIFQKTLESFV